MSEKIQDRPEYEWLSEFVREQGNQMRARYGAHGIDVGWKTVGGKKTGQHAVRFYVSQKRPSQQCGEQAIPPVISFTPRRMREAVELITDVVESAPAELE